MSRPPSPHPSRRDAIAGGLGLLAGVAGCSGPASPTPHGQHLATRTFATPAPLAPLPGQRVVERTLTPAPATLDLGGRTVQTWAYDGIAPGPLVRANAGDLLRLSVRNQLPTETTIHWHGIRLRNVADGVPGLTQNPVAAGDTYVHEFTAPDPGTYFFHPHVGVQIDRGLYAPLVIDDPQEPGDYDAEWIVVLDDWIDGTGSTPDEVLAGLIADGGGAASDGMGGMGGMGHGDMGGMGGMSMGSPPWGRAGDVAHPLHLVNGRAPDDPDVLTARPGARIRLRVINAAADTVYTLALGGHRLTVTHTDGYAVQPADVGALYVGMGERYDLLVTVGDGVFPLVARPFGKETGGQGVAFVRTGSGSVPRVDVTPVELTGPVLVGSDLRPAESTLLPARSPDTSARVTLQGSMKPYVWGINGAPYGQNEPLTVISGQRLRLHAMNMSMMTHPLHVHGHTFALPSGLRKDTVLMAPMQSLAIDVQADNPGDWMVHCHNAYHGEAGMMIGLEYRD